MTETKNNDCASNEYYLQNIYWVELQQLKFETVYYDLYFNLCIKASRILKYIIAVLTTIILAVLMSFSQYSIALYVCGAVGIFIQIISALSSIFPFESRKEELREMNGKLSLIFNQMELDWYKIVQGTLSLEEISVAIETYTNKHIEISNYFFRNDYLQERKRIVQKAEEKTHEYFLLR